MKHDALIVPPGNKIRLKDFDPGYTGKYHSKEDALVKLETNVLIAALIARGFCTASCDTCSRLQNFILEEMREKLILKFGYLPQLAPGAVSVLRSTTKGKNLPLKGIKVAGNQTCS